MYFRCYGLDFLWGKYGSFVMVDSNKILCYEWLELNWGLMGFFEFKECN